MKALYFNEHGPIDNLNFGSLPEPKCGKNEVLVKVHAAALNHLDLWVLKGWPGLNLKMPHIGGADISGEIAELGDGVNNWKVGDSVIVSPGYLEDGPKDEWTKSDNDSVSPRYRIFGESCPGGFAELVSVPAHTLAAKPEKLNHREAAAVLLVGLTSWRMLKVRAEVSPGQSVLIVGAGGGLNSFSIQVAKLLGAEVFALSSSKEKLRKAENLGADHLLNYKDDPNWHKAILKYTKGRGVDVVVDNVGAATMSKSISCLVRGGKLVTVGNTSGPVVQLDNRHIFVKQVSILGSTMGSRADFLELQTALSAGKLKPVIDSILPLNEGKRAYQLLKDGSQFGKIVLTTDL